MRLANSIKKCFEIFFLEALFLFDISNIKFTFVLIKTYGYEKIVILFYDIHCLNVNFVFYIKEYDIKCETI